MKIGKWTAQEVLNKVWDHFVVKRGKPGYTTDVTSGTCIYGKPGDVARCAVGVLDEGGFLSDLSGSISQLHSELPNSVSAALGGDVDEGGVSFLTSLQIAHDNVVQSTVFHELIAENLSQVAVRFNLTVPS